ncbi:DUF3089 domain-containing protein [Variovorax sp. dw_954]|uniref:DUF3089 domain-containing protein n=1 Tax=Variovorax sp. dw_954 TaxID=2720078 RepID=UPI001BD3B760|nr:DUF3089 domain-containing protein [Variovorax sp. dw_954]
MTKRFLFISLWVVLFGADGASAQPAVAAGVDYKADASWLCRPGRTDACSRDQIATRVEADGRRTIEPFQPAAAPAIDCFYVYPTVSRERTMNSALAATQAEREVANQQFARFASRCRLYAPLYRQLTLHALVTTVFGERLEEEGDVAYADVKAAWQDYLARDNQGRGFVLIGHSQGARWLTRLIREEIDGQPVQSHMVSALLMGTNLAVPKGADVGGAFQHVPLCRKLTQTGCVVAYASFRAESPPPDRTLFGKVAAPGQVAACVNPAALAGGEGALMPYFSSGDVDITGVPSRVTSWLKNGDKLGTPFVTTPGLLSAECVSNAQGDYLAVTTHADAVDQRIDHIPGDVVVAGVVLKGWGLHLVDVNLTLGNLLALLERQTAAYLARQ